MNLVKSFYMFFGKEKLIIGKRYMKSDSGSRRNIRKLKIQKSIKLSRIKQKKK